MIVAQTKRCFYYVERNENFDIKQTTAGQPFSNKSVENIWWNFIFERRCAGQRLYSMPVGGCTEPLYQWPAIIKASWLCFIYCHVKTGATGRSAGEYCALRGVWDSKVVPAHNLNVELPSTTPVHYKTQHITKRNSLSVQCTRSQCAPDTSSLSVHLVLAYAKEQIKNKHLLQLIVASISALHGVVLTNQTWRARLQFVRQIHVPSDRNIHKTNIRYILCCTNITIALLHIRQYKIQYTAIQVGSNQGCGIRYDRRRSFQSFTRTHAAVQTVEYWI